jgi:hypothetical protein
MQPHFAESRDDNASLLGVPHSAQSCQTNTGRKLYEQNNSRTCSGGLWHHLFIPFVDVSTRFRASDGLATIHSVLCKREAAVIGAACFGFGLLRLRMVQPERHAQALGWLLCRHDDGSGLPHGTHHHRGLVAGPSSRMFSELDSAAHAQPVRRERRWVVPLLGLFAGLDHLSSTQKWLRLILVA